MAQASATAKWSGGIKSGGGQISSRSGVLDGVKYDFRKRFEGDPGTNPEELIAAAHAGCFSMALSGQIEKAGHEAEAIEATASVTLTMVDGAPTVTKVHLDVTAKVPGAAEEDFRQAAQEAKENCPISRLLKAEITMEARLG